jgi:hypothetical protein
MSSEKHIGFFYENIFFQKIKNRSRWSYSSTQNWILRRTTVTEFSKTFLVFYKWPDLTDVQGVVTSSSTVFVAVKSV